MLLKKEYHPIVPNIYVVVTHKSFCLFFKMKLENSGQIKGILNCLLHTEFPHIVSAETILFSIWKSKGHSTYDQRS